MPLVQSLAIDMGSGRSLNTGAKVSIMVDPKGGILDCRVLAVAGDEDTADRMCKLLTRRKIRPATDPQGNTLHSMLQTTISFTDAPHLRQRFMGALKAVSLPADIQLQTSAVAPGSPERRAELTVVIGEQGRLLACEPEGPPDPFSEAACAYLADIKLPKLEPQPGVPVRHARSFTVAFVPEGPALPD